MEPQTQTSRPGGRLAGNGESGFVADERATCRCTTLIVYRQHYPRNLVVLDTKTG
jgi:hypothetical protein